MLALIQSIRNFFSLISGIFLPMFYSGARAMSGVGRTVLWLLHFLLLFAILGVLYYVNNQYIRRNLTDVPLINQFWLPALFSIFYILIWVIWKLVQVLAMEPDASDFPDIDEAWSEALSALDKAGIDPTDAPIFLVLGKPAGGEEALFQAADRKFVVQGAPNRNAPLHVYASRDEIFITCAGASLVGQQTAFFEGVVPANLSSPSSGSETGGGGPGTGRIEDFEAGKKVQEFLAAIARQGRGPHQLTPEEQQTLKRLEESGEDPSSVRRTYLHSFPEEVGRTSARLEHLCRLIELERRPYCPINGILALLPLAGTERFEDASETGSCLQDDLAVIRETLRIQCPILTMVCDLERLPGFREFISPMTRTQLRQRMGQRFPYIPDVKPDQIPAMLEAGIQWIGLSLFTSFTYTLLRLETPDRNDYTEAVRANIRLFRFVTALRERQKNLGHILSRAFGSEQAGPPMFGGCYLAGTGRDPMNDQAFIVGVFDRPSKDQELVSWTEEAIEEDASCNFWSKVGYVVVFVVALGIAGGLFLWFKNQQS
ncbi:MAG: type VI secretion protein IcmF/TssM N-terminal domain-containing protein [Isosphaeraceae bacterium]|nr:type VI secretion protein IcmF/TssM N-terminal domain-containing protein [Isosphaeraceae bacterium]